MTRCGRRRRRRGGGDQPVFLSSSVWPNMAIKLPKSKRLRVREREGRKKQEKKRGAYLTTIHHIILYTTHRSLWVYRMSTFPTLLSSTTSSSLPSSSLKECKHTNWISPGHHKARWLRLPIVAYFSCCCSHKHTHGHGETGRSTYKRNQKVSAPCCHIVRQVSWRREIEKEKRRRGGGTWNPPLRECAVTHCDGCLALAHWPSSSPHL